MVNLKLPDEPIEQWLSSLQRHPIFTDDVYPDNIQSCQDTKSSIIALRGADLFVALGSKIRCLDMRECKSKVNEDETGCSKSVYTTLQTPEIDFQIYQLEISKAGRYVVAVGTTRVAVVTLPRKAISKINEQHFRSKTHLIGKIYHSEATGNHIVKAIWHPFGKNDGSLLVMSSDSMLRLYDLALSYNEPEQTIDLFPSRYETRSLSNKKGLFIAGEDEIEAASCTFGTGTDDWSPFSVYIVMRNGDIYAVCPVVPSQCSASRLYLDRLACYISAKSSHVSELARQDPQRDMKAEIDLYRQQTRWISDVLGQVSSAEDFGLGSPSAAEVDHSLVNFRRPNVVRPQATVHGPFLFQPPPAEFSTLQTEATDILSLPTSPVGLLVISYSDGKVDVCIESEKIEALWLGKPASDRGEKYLSLPPVSTYESINLKLGYQGQKPEAFSRVSLCQDTRQTEIFYAYHSGGVHAISVQSWISMLAEAFENENDSLLEEVFQARKPSLIRQLVDSRPLSQKDGTPIVGCCVLLDTYLGCTLLSLSAELQLVGFELDEGVASEDESDETPLDSDMSNIPRYRSLLSHPTYGSLALVEKAPVQPKLIIPPSARGQLEVTEDSLRFLGKSAQANREQMHALYLAAVSMHQRLDLQLLELQRQLEKLRESQLKLSTSSNAEERVEKAVSIQKDLQNRADILLQKLMNNHSPILSDHEKKWFDELKRISIRIEGSRGFDQRLQTVRKDWQRLKPAIEEAKSLGEQQNADPETLRRREEYVVLGTLLQDSLKIVNQTKSQVEKLLKID
ncbi:Nucleoporin nup82 [Neolecta irregularis DAH-3]|uniref:Nucleoporin nup82 n=1 Tax=Neolecta irregularis (strain DAH-3) TaxID=1198029 RepID=A0A1U7LS04_NEOID|nr:Nucleoporin nup82 [Neolecta irregularis DAH-3]|eukprot:OLL25409.1 Nucleoporin nup82 [Neolecta irregularis DAH-3]